MHKDLISIITPVYNVEPYIKRCLKSIINQTYTNWELILVNDGSSDKSGEICYSFANKDNRIIYLEQDNQGQSSARNKALDKVRGKYICFIDSDDWVDERYLEYLYDAIEYNNSEIAICGHIVTNGIINQTIYVPTNKTILNANEFKRKLIIDEIRSFLVDKIFLKEIINGNRFIKGIYYEDYRFYNEILPKITKDVPVVNKPLYYYFQRINSTTHIRRFKHVLDQYNAYKSRFELNYLNQEEKAYCLKGLLQTYCRFLQVKNFDKKNLYKFKKYILTTDKLLFSEAKKLMTPNSLALFLLAFRFPILYKIIFKLYKLFINKK